MATTAVLFAGQGAQSVGMGRDVVEASPEARQVFEQAGNVLGYDLAAVCFDGPAEKLEQTDIQQPAIFTTSVAIWRALEAEGASPEKPFAMAGLSLGEYTALHVAGSVAFEDALKLVKRRGELMQAAARSHPGGMVAAFGLDAEQLEAICEEAASNGPIGPANFNSPGQIVLSGAKPACDAAAKLIEAAGARAVPLKVAGAFHSELMAPAARELSQTLADTPFDTPTIPVVANVDCEYHSGPDDTRRRLTDQLTHPVRWQGSMERLITEGVEQFIEIGPGRVLSGLMKKINRRMPITNISTAENLAAAGSRAA
jgi:[acyl-carrier-protein] S-malonyltransferase